MVVHIVKGLDNFKLYAIIATIGLVLISVSYFLFWRNFNPRSSTLNMVGAICLVVSFKIAQMSDEGNLDSRNFYIGIASFASAIPIGLFLAYNFPYRIKKDVDDLEEDNEEEVEEDGKEEGKGFNENGPKGR